jgi:hypothetical protein
VGELETTIAGGLDKPLQPTRKTANRMAVETLGNCGIVMHFPGLEARWLKRQELRAYPMVGACLWPKIQQLASHT